MRYMELNVNEDVRSLGALLVMVLTGVLVVLAVGELIRFFLPADVLFNQLVTKAYLIGTAVFILMLGLGKINLNNVKNLTAAFVFIMILIMILFQADRLASSMLWGGQYTSVLDMVPDRYVSWTMLGLDGIALILGATGAFMLLLKALDRLKDALTAGVMN